MVFKGEVCFGWEVFDISFGFLILLTVFDGFLGGCGGVLGYDIEAARVQ